MSSLSEHLYACIDNIKSENLLQEFVGADDLIFNDKEAMHFNNNNSNNFSTLDPIASFIGMDVEGASPSYEDLMVEDSDSLSPLEIYDSPFTSSPLSSSSSSPSSLSSSSVMDEFGMIMKVFNNIPSYFQEQLFTHHGLYLKEVQQILEMQNMDIIPSPPFSPEDSPVSGSPMKEKRKKSMPSFKVEHYRIHNTPLKRAKTEDAQSPSSGHSNPFLYSNNDRSPRSLSPKSLPTAAEELASVLLPPVSQIEEECRAGTSSPSAATTVIELTRRPELLTLKQSEAARIMGISTSVLSKRWREVTRGKKWPHRIHHKLKKAEIS